MKYRKNYSRLLLTLACDFLETCDVGSRLVAKAVVHSSQPMKQKQALEVNS